MVEQTKGARVALELTDAQEVWLSLDLAYGLAESDCGLLDLIVGFFGDRLRLGPGAWSQMLDDIQSRDPWLSGLGTTAADALDGVPEVDDIWPAGDARDFNLAGKAIERDIHHPRPEMRRAAVDLILGAGRMRTDEVRPVVLASQHVRAQRWLETRALGVHHVVAFMERTSRTATPDLVWDRLEAARMKAAMPFFGPTVAKVPIAGTREAFIAFIDGDDDAEF